MFLKTAAVGVIRCKATNKLRLVCCKCRQLLLAVGFAVFREGVSSWFKNLITKTFLFNTARLVFWYKNYIGLYKTLHISTGLTCPNFRWFYLSSRPANNLQSYAYRVSCPVMLLVLKKNAKNTCNFARHATKMWICTSRHDRN